MVTITFLNPDLEKNISLAPKRLIAKWDIGQREVFLLRESNNRLGFSTDRSTDQTRTFGSTLYDVEYAVSLISMFHQTIGVNLQREEIHSSCFLPMLCIEAHCEQGVQVALFGRVDTKRNVRGELKGLRWGVFNSLTKENETFEVEEGDIVRKFIPPRTNQSHMESGLDKKNKPIMKPADNHYALNAYAKRFSVVLTRDPATHCIQRVALHHVSLLDRTVLLDKSNWAVTLVSALHSSENDYGLFTRLFASNAGHAMLACEGVEEDKPFLRYLHFTQRLRNKRDKNPELKDDEAQIESFERNVPLDTLNGPTWMRSKALVENMFRFVQENRGKRFKFAFYGSYFSSSIPWGLFLRNEIIDCTPTPSYAMFQYRLDHARKLEDEPMTCLDCVYRVAERGGIIFQGNRPLTKPIKKIEIVKLAPIFSIPPGYNQFLGQPFFGNHNAISEQILSACVLLTPNDCTVEECIAWGWQTLVEEDAATEREIERINTASIGEIWNGYNPKRW